jgi:predicted lipoprotein with Yx(FWY)xxD motif
MAPVLRVCILALLALGPPPSTGASANQTEDSPPLVAPLGITFSEVQVGPEVASGFKNTLEKTARLAFANEAGLTLYSRTGPDDAARCENDCADWKPLAPANGVNGEGSWAIVRHGDGAAQWAYKGRPVYTYAKDDAVGEAAREGKDGVWRAVLVDLTSVGQLPDGVTVQAMDQAAGHILADDDGMPLYVFSGKHMRSAGACAPSPCGDWLPVTAPALAPPVGAFTLAEYEPGIRQWALNGVPLYRYAQDVRPGDVKGAGVDPATRPALVARYFMPAEAAIRPNHFGGFSLVSASGMTLYTRDSAGAGSGQNLRTGTHGSPAIGRALGAAACDESCARIWPPLLAPPDALAAGYWTPIRRGDGAMQWAYQGYALYTYTGDKAPGDINGFDIYQYAAVGETIGVGSTGGVHIAGVPPSDGLSQMHWRAVVP